MGSILPVSAITEETLSLAKAAFGNPQTGPGLSKAGINIAESLVGINLEAPSKKLFPVYSPLRNKIARVKSPVGATAVQWRQIDAINSANLWPGVAENTRNSFNTTATSSKSATFVTLGHDDYVGFEALAASKSFEDVRATAALNLLYAAMISEEKVILGGNASNIGKPASLTATPAITGGSLTTAGGGVYKTAVSALVLRGYDQGATGHASADADGETDGRTATDATVASGSTGSIALVWPAVKGAVAYNVFVSDEGGSTRKYLATTTVNGYTIKTTAASTNVPNTADKTGNSLEYDGFIASIEGNASPAALFKDMANGTLTSDSAGGISEIDAILKAMWDSYRLGPNEILVNSQQALDITKKIGSSSNLAYRIMLQDGQRNVTGGIYVGSYLNKFASSFAEGIPNEVPIRIHPNMPASTILFPVYALPYPNNQVPNVWEIENRQEYTQYEWALSQRRYEFGIYWQSVLKSYFPKAQAAMVGVAAG
jgi:hypothetical protein